MTFLEIFYKNNGLTAPVSRYIIDLLVTGAKRMAGLNLHFFDNPEIDYQLLINLLSSYKQPRDKITKLLKSGDLIRVKKGLYVLGHRYKKAFSPMVLANLIYGPSYISQEYALSLHSIIPETVHTITSMTTKKAKRYVTPVGIFKYAAIPEQYYSAGIERLAVDSKRSYLIASREKAIADIVYRRRDIRSTKDMLGFLLSSLRIEEKVLLSLQLSFFENLQRLASKSTISLLFQALKELHEQNN